MADVIIIGAGMAGLSAALELKRLGHDYLILEAASEAGGRGLTRRLPSGVMADLGAHWLHGKDNPLHALVAQYHIPYHQDKAEQLYIYRGGKVEKSRHGRWLEEAIDQKKAKRIETGEEPDCPMTDVAKDAHGRELLANFGLLWNGIDAALEPSAYEFLTEKSTPGGFQLDGGISRLIQAMLSEAGREHIRYNVPVTAISNTESGVRVRDGMGNEWQGKRAIFTGSVAVIKQRLVAFDPPLSHDLQAYLSGLALGKMNKIVVELDAKFFEERKIPKDMSLELLEGDWPHFCHVRSGGAPLINLFISGSRAEDVESLNSKQALDYVRTQLLCVKELQGFENRVVSDPIVSRWVSNPYTRCSYFSCLPGVKRKGPVLERHVCYCGDSFDDTYPASLAGAYLSGRNAARKIAGQQ